MSFAITGTVLTIGTTAYANHQAGKAADAQVGAARDATAESGRQFDLTRADTASGRSLYEGANSILGQVFGIPVQTSQQFQNDTGDLFGTQGGIPTVNAQRYASDPAYRYAWDQTLATEKATRPGWSGQPTYFMRGTDADFARINESLTRGIADYRAKNPTAPGMSGGTPGQPNMNAFFASPSYNFRRTEGTRGIERSAAARGGAASGNALRALNEFNSNLASGEYGNWLDSVFRAAGLGSNAVNTSVAAGENHADRAGRNALLAGDARASGIENRANLIGQGVNSIAGGLGYLWRGRQGNELQEIPMYSLPRRI